MVISDYGLGTVQPPLVALLRDAALARQIPLVVDCRFGLSAYRDVTAMCQQVWGGVGFTIEYDIQLYFRRAKQLQITWWDAPYLEELIAADVLDGDGPVRVASW